MTKEQQATAARDDCVETDDANVAAVRAKLLKRSGVGLTKYGVTTDRAELTPEQWLTHLQEELMDGAVYIEAFLRTLAGPSFADPSPEALAKGEATEDRPDAEETGMRGTTQVASR